MKTKRRGKFIEPAGKQRFDRFRHKLMQFLAPGEKHRVVGDIMCDRVFENVFPFLQPGRF
jgi:hypothetical protein